MNENSDLSRQPIVDKNGVISSRLKKNAPNAGKVSPALASQSPVSNAVPTLPTDIDWEVTSPERARKLGEIAVAGLDDPDKVWSNIDFYRGMLESSNSRVAVSLIGEHRVIKRISGAWHKLHNIDPDGDLGDSKITEEELDQYHAAVVDLSMSIEMAGPIEVQEYRSDSPALKEQEENSSEEVPDAKGSFISWSSLNPFKRRKN